MREDIEENQTETENQVTCPVCEETFLDMRGLTSHARHVHEMDNEKVTEILDKQENGVKKYNLPWKIIGGVGAICAGIFAAVKFR